MNTNTKSSRPQQQMVKLRFQQSSFHVGLSRTFIFGGEEGGLWCWQDTEVWKASGKRGRGILASCL